MTFRELQDQTLRALGYNPESLAAEPRDRIKDALNAWHRRLMTRPVLAQMLRSAYTLTLDSVTGQAAYGLPYAIEKILAVRDVLNDYYLPQVPLRTIREQDPGLASEGVSQVWALRGLFPVQVQPSAACYLGVVSTSTADTMVASLEYIDSSSVQQRVALTLTGTTPVTTTTKTAVEVVGFDLSSSAAGTVTLAEASAISPYTATQTLATIPANQTSARHWWIHLYPTPTATVTYTLDVTRRLTDLLRDGEEPLLPRDFHDVLLAAVQIEEWRRKGDLERSELMRRDYELRLRELEWWCWNQPALATRADLDPPSRLGSWFPTGS